MSAQVGIMQGRLLPPYEGRFQAFPAAQWREEFARAKEAGLACIEWIYEEPHEADNPLGSKAGRDEIRRAVDKTGVEVRSVCADYYMTQPLVSMDGAPRDAAVRHLRWLLSQAGELNLRYIVLPFVDSSSLKSPDAVNGAANVLKQAAPLARDLSIELHIECDLPPRGFRALLEAIADPVVKANYDIGNSASLGYPVQEELTAIGAYLGSVHVKDRQRGAGTVPLGTGAADFPASFAALRKAGFNRWFILQAARGVPGEEVELARQNREFVMRLWPPGG